MPVYAADGCCKMYLFKQEGKEDAMKKLIALLLALAAVMVLAACASLDRQSGADTTGSEPGEVNISQATSSESGRIVGISMPNDADGRWSADAENMAGQLQALGCQVVLQYAGDDALLQASQVEKMILQPVDCLVIAAVDSMALTDTLAQAKTAGIPVIAYDRQLMNTDAVSYYVAFDSKTVGTAIGDYIVEEKQLQTAQEESRSYTIEFFMGSPDDNNAVLLHQGIMMILQPYLDSGVLVCSSGRTSFEDTCVQSWSKDTAQEDCGNYLAAHYVEEKLDICCAASDSLAYGCRAALEAVGYTAQEGWPLITGQNAELAAVRNILSGYQTMTVYKDTRLLVDQCVSMVRAVLSGVQVEVNDTATCDNGTMIVPAYLYTPAGVDADNYHKILVDSGRYTEEQLTGEGE